jgi:F-type H+-transporting ATPase subunit c
MMIMATARVIPTLITDRLIIPFQGLEDWMKFNKWVTLATAMVAMLLISDSAMAQQAAADNSKGLIGLAAGFGIGIAVLGGAIGQGMAARGTYESIARNPSAAGQIQTPFFVGMALIESLVLLAFVITIGLSGKI